MAGQSRNVDMVGVLIFSKNPPRSDVERWSAECGDNVLGNGLVVKAGDIAESVGDPSQVIYPGSDSDLAEVMWQ